MQAARGGLGSLPQRLFTLYQFVTVLSHVTGKPCRWMGVGGEAILGSVERIFFSLAIPMRREGHTLSSLILIRQSWGLVSKAYCHCLGFGPVLWALLPHWIVAPQHMEFQWLYAGFIPGWRSPSHTLVVWKGSSSLPPVLGEGSVSRFYTAL